MSRWSRWGWFKPAPKKPPPAHGIRMKQVGATWWGQCWIEALETVLRGDSGRLARGRTYARAGRTHDLIVKDGRVSARVTGSRATPYTITMQLAELSDATWRKAIVAMASKAQFAAELLAGQMPKDIDEAFRGAGSSLFPRVRADLATACSCPDWGDPCKHVAATHYVLGEALDRDPFLLFELRGRTKDQVLDALRGARTPAAAGKGKGKGRGGRSAKPRDELGSAPASEPAVAKVTLGKLEASDYDRPREALPALRLSFDAPAAHAAVLRQLGTPATWGSETTPADVLAPLVRAAADEARRMAMAEGEAEVAQPSERRRRRRG